MTPVLTEQQWQDDLDRETVRHERDRDRSRFPDPAKVRRVRIDDTSHQMAQAVHADHERERRGADDGNEGTA